jgi:replicative superfamily II helicase
MSYQELYDIYRDAKRRMMDARDKVERATWMVMFRWAVEEIKRATPAGTVVTPEQI